MDQSIQWRFYYLSSCFVKQEHEVVIVVGYGIRTNQLILKVVNPNLKLVFLPDAAKVFLPVQLGAMFEFHASFWIVVVHDLLERNAQIHTALPIENIITLHYLLHA